MELKACSSCRRLFYDTHNEQRCPSCVALKYEEIKKISRFFTYNQKATIQDAESQLNIERKNILSYLREEKIELPPLSEDSVECKRCGKTIKTGEYCNVCKAELINGFNAGLKKETPAEVKPRMRYLNTERRNSRRF